MRQSQQGIYLRSVKLLREAVPSFDAYPFHLCAIQSLEQLDFHPKVTYIVGENGMGKSTLMEVIAVGLGFNPGRSRRPHYRFLRREVASSAIAWRIFFATFLHRFNGNGLYMMDEPEAALSPFRQMAMLSRIHQLVLQHSQFIIATHSPILMAYPDAVIYNLTSDGIERISLEETDHYILMKQFINNRERMLQELFLEEE